jgi:hypothetical protein
MAKIKLDVDSLQIESFDTTEVALERGTVVGHSDRWTVCQESCDGTCYTHCWGGDCGGDDHGPTVSYCTQILNCTQACDNYPA